MTSTTRGRIANAMRAAAPMAVAVTVAATLMRFPPEQSSLYPRCPIYEYLHLQCPGCGATRALAALLRGHFSEAMHCNALVVPLLPVATACGALWYYSYLQRRVMRWPQLPQAAIYGAFGIATAFTILRNLPPQFF
jgi:hypothetical protein